MIMYKRLEIEEGNQNEDYLNYISYYMNILIKKNS